MARNKKQSQSMHLTAMISAELENAGAAKKRALRDKVIEMALNGDMQAINLIFNRTEGAVPQHITLAEDAESPFGGLINSADEVLKRLRQRTPEEATAILNTALSESINELEKQDEVK